MEQECSKFMWRCLELARIGAGFVESNPMVGAVLVRDGKVVDEDYHRAFGENHAERNLLLRTPGIEPDDILYVNLEPCCHVGKTPACTDIILEKGVMKVVVGMLDPDPRVSGKGVEVLRSNGVKVKVLSELGEISNFKFQISNGGDELNRLKSDLVWLNRFFVKHRLTGIPWVTVKMAITEDRMVAFSGSELKVQGLRDHFWITGEVSRDHVHRTRGDYGAILVGSGTVIADDPELTTHGKSEWKPWRIVLDRRLESPRESRVFNDQFRDRTIVVTDSGEKWIDKKGVAVWRGSFEINDLLKKIGKFGITSVYVEGGPTIWKSFFDSGFVDEVQVYQSPNVMEEGVHCGVELDRLGDRFVLRDLEKFGSDIWKRWVRKSVL